MTSTAASTDYAAAEYTRPRRRGRALRELGYAVLGLPLGIFGFASTFTLFAIGCVLTILFIGLPLLGIGGLFARTLGSGVRQLANRQLDAHIETPRPFVASVGDRGLLRWTGAALRDGAAWRARVYLMLKLPLGILTFVVSAVFYVGGLGAVSYWFWRQYLHCNDSTDGVCHRSMQLGNHYFLDTTSRIATVIVIGVLVLLLAPFAVRAAVSFDRVLTRALLGATARDQRLAELERSRAVAVDDAAATLRRIERDLHDGAQARLVALAMNVGLAREKLGEGSDPSDVDRLLATAQGTAKQAITELRDLVRGIHPPVLDAGLDAALATLAAHSAVPVRLTTEVRTRPHPAIETIAYFCAAELLTNATKHSGATHIDIDARTVGDRLRVTVRDDGRGGALLGVGTGLTGIAERASTVDGRLDIDSATGGPTIMTVDLPLQAAQS